MKRRSHEIGARLDRLLARHRTPSPKRMQVAIDRVGRQIGSAKMPLSAPVAQSTGFSRAWLAAAATVALAAAIGFAMFWPERGTPLYRVLDGAVHDGNTIRSDGGVGAVLSLTDGSGVEMRSQSELALEHADDGVRIRLHRGGIIVHAAKQRAGRLYVVTKDMTVSVVGTVFVVNADESGSRVAVIEGEVRVQQGATEKKLLPGQQVATDPALPPAPMAEEVSWSRNATSLVAMLQQAPVPLAKPEPQEAFEEAVIRPSAPGQFVGGRAGGGGGSAVCTDNGPLGIGSVVQVDPRRFSASGMTLYTLIAWAHGKNCGDALRADLISGGPAWVRSDRFDVEAVLPKGSPAYTPEQLASGAAPTLQRMLRTLLAQRFKLAVHTEVKDTPAFALRLGGGPHKLRESRPGVFKQNGLVGSQDSNGQMVATWVTRGVSMAEVAAGLAQRLQRPVFDETGLTGQFSFNFIVSPGSSGSSGIADAVHDQLGLRLEPTVVPMEMLVIDAVEKPTGN